MFEQFLETTLRPQLDALGYSEGSIMESESLMGQLDRPTGFAVSVGTPDGVELWVFRSNGETYFLVAKLPF